MQRLVIATATALLLAACNGGSTDPAAGTGARQTKLPPAVT